MPPRLEPTQRVPYRSVSCSCLSRLLDHTFDATRICKSVEQHPWMSGASLFVQSAELVQRRGAAGIEYACRKARARLGSRLSLRVDCSRNGSASRWDRAWSVATERNRS